MKNYQKNTGLALPVILILLLVMTILGVTSLSNSALQDKMVSSQVLRQTAFNLAETTLREAELHIETLLQNVDFRKGILQTQSGTDFYFFGLDPETDRGWPAETADNAGDDCIGGYCTPVEHDSDPLVTIDRWLDPEVWEDPERHRVVESFTDDMDLKLLDLNTLERPKYIIEFMGQVYTKNQKEAVKFDILDSACADNQEELELKVTEYPYCPRDPYLFRITARVLTGVGQRQSQVMLQSTVVVNL